MAPMPRRNLPFLLREKTRHGVMVWYVRKGKGQRVRINGKFGTAEFLEDYHAALQGVPAHRRAKAPVGSLEWLIIRYRETAAWSGFSVATKRQRENILKHVIEQSGNVAFVDVKRSHIREGLNKRRDKPAAMRHFLETMRGLFQWALDADHIEIDPTAGIKTPRRKSDGHHVWSDEECSQFEAKWPLGTRQRVAFDVLLYTGFRRGDAVRLGRQHVRDGIATLRTEKTGEIVSTRILPQLATSLEAGPTGDLAFIVGDKGHPLTKESFGNWFREACKAAGVPGSAHGLRKAGATRAANAGATEHELMAMFGWSEPRTAAIYTRKANRHTLSLQGGDKVQKRDGLPRTLRSGAGNVPENDDETGT